MPEVKFELDQEFTFKKILFELEKYDKYKQKKIKEATGIDPQYISNMLQKGESRQSISLPAVILFAKALKRPIEYFLYPESVFVDLSKEEFINIPYIENNQDENGNLVFSRKNSMCIIRYNVIAEIADNPLKVVLYKVDSDVMEHTISKGDEVLIDTSKKDIRDGLIYAFNTFDLKYIRLRRLFCEINTIQLIADNSVRYGICLASRKDINIIGKVIMAKHFL